MSLLTLLPQVGLFFVLYVVLQLQNQVFCCLEWMQLAVATVFHLFVTLQLRGKITKLFPMFDAWIILISLAK